MKGLIWLTVISVVVVWAAYAGLGLKLGEDSGQMIGFACGNPMNDKVQLQIVIAMGMTRKDPPRSEATKQGLYVDWENWIADHFILRSAAGETIELQRQHFGNLIPSAKVGTPDSYLIGFLIPGETYTLDYCPVLADGKYYRHTFTPTNTGLPYQRATFALVEENS